MLKSKETKKTYKGLSKTNPSKGKALSVPVPGKSEKQVVISESLYNKFVKPNQANAKHDISESESEESLYGDYVEDFGPDINVYSEESDNQSLHPDLLNQLKPDPKVKPVAQSQIQGNFKTFSADAMDKKVEQLIKATENKKGLNDLADIMQPYQANNDLVGPDMTPEWADL